MKKIGFLFPGQGSQFVGMGKDLYNRFSVVKNLFEEINKKLGIDVINVMFNGPETKLRNTLYTQLAVFLHSIAVDILLKEEGVTADCVAGHSLGEYTAIVSAEGLSFEEGLRLVYYRAKIMAENNNDKLGKMVAVIGLGYDEIKKVCDEVSSSGKVVSIANYNTQTQIVVSGENKAVDSVCDKLLKKGAKKIVPLAVGGAFHSYLMLDAQKKFVEYINRIKLNDTKIPIVLNTTATITQNKDEIKKEMESHMISTVRWYDSVKKMLEFGINTFIEIGPGKVLKGLLMEIDRKIKVFSTYNVSEIEYTLKNLGTI
jgi:[acyl-carrier-protein] S-malonyltransferase